MLLTDLFLDYLEMQDYLSTQVTVDIISTQKLSVHARIVLRAYINKTQIFVYNTPLVLNAIEFLGLMDFSIFVMASEYLKGK